MEKTHIKVFITKTNKFRAIVKNEFDQKYEVTINGKSWKEGKGVEHRERIFLKINNLIAHLTKERDLL